MNVEKIMTTDLACCTPDTKLTEVASLMKRYNCGSIPVVDSLDSRKLKGIITDRDIVTRALAAGRNPENLTAKEVMTNPVYFCNMSSDIEECIETMERHHVRRVPVVDDTGACCGIVGLADLAAQVPTKKVGEVIKEVTEPIRQSR
jgi:CBS domain-containing protein